MRNCAIIVSLALALPVVAAANAPALDLTEARRHFMTGTDAYQRQEYPRAAREFEAAYRLTHDPLLRLNVGEAEERAGNRDAAVAAYRGYLAGLPSAANRADVARRTRRLEAELASGPGPAAPVGGAELTAPTPPAPEPEGPGKLRLAAWVTAAATVALAATGGVLTLASRSRESQAASRLHAVDPQTGQPWPPGVALGDYRDLVEQGRRYETLSVVFYSAAAGAALAAGTLFYLDHRRRGAERSARMRVVPQVGPRSAGLVAGVEF